MRWFVDACYLLAAVFLSPLVAYRAITLGKYRQDWGQRRGWLPEFGPAGRRIWIHAVSVGEINAVRGLVQAWRRREPQTEMVISCTTDTGLARARELFGELTVVRYPLDLSRFVDRALDRIQPTMIVLVELEIWYQFVTRAAARGIPVAVVNGRLSEQSVRRFAWVRPLAGRMFRSLAWVGAQDETYAERFRRMGVPPERVHVTSSMKWDTAELADHLPGSEALAQAMGLDPAQPTWVCGSTGPDEEAVILKARDQLVRNHPGLQVVLVPRKPERFEEVAALVRRRGLRCVRRSESPDGTRREPAVNTVFLADTMGELRKIYTLADVVFVGRTLAPMGGSDMMEVAALARPVVVGPHTENFLDTVQRLAEADAIRIVPVDVSRTEVVDALARTIGDLLKDRQAARAQGLAGRQVVQRNRGAIERTLNALVEILDRAQHHAPPTVDEERP